MNLNSLAGKNVLITGATGGIGVALVGEFARYGCKVFTTGRNEKKLKQVHSLAESYGASIGYCTANLRDPNEIKELIETVREKMPKIDVLVNCAGVFPVNSLTNSTFKEFNECFDINIRAPFLLSKEFSKDMIRSKWGRIVNIGSSSSYSGFKQTSVYCASKHALLGLSRSLSAELKEHNIKVYCFSPGSVKTEMGKKVKGQDFDTFIDI